MKVSIIIPLFNERESLEELFEKLEQSMADFENDYEYIFVDDGSTDGSLEVLRSLNERSDSANVLSFRRNCGKSAALNAGFDRAAGDYVVTIDADLQDDPLEIPGLIHRLEDGLDLVSGWKKDRKDPWTKKIPSKFFNFVTSRISGLKLHDFNCGLKAYRRDVVKCLSIYGELHRFIPVLAGWEGFAVGETAVRHFKRKHGRSKYGARRFLNGFFDLMTVMFITRRAKNPLHFFGRLAIILFTIGAIPQVVFFFQYLRGTGLRVRPIMLAGFVLIIVALQIASVGLVAELISASQDAAPTYSVKEDLKARMVSNREKEEKSMS